MQTTETATGKILLSGEHSVVYGQPALVSSVDVGLSVTINDQKKTQHHDVYTAHILHIFSQVNNIDVSKITITTESQMKSKSGMGSSAAYAFALLKSLHSFFEISVTADQLFEQVLKAETFVHVHPSGVDPAAVVYGGIQVFQKTPNGFLRTHLQLAEPITFHCVYSG
ncbi:hypothetical protein KC721_00935, partial [Candidatus Woesebacteria bacterium]|nr:hypothetical protein [Candidatus Woesebacteria bacterium]